MTIPCVRGPVSVMAHDWGHAGVIYEMPQTVPSAGYSPQCDYDFATDDFDLTLLPSVQSTPTTPYTGEVDGEVPYSPTNLQQLMALLGDPTQSPPPMFPMTDSFSVKMEPMAPTPQPQPEPLASGWENQPTFLSSVASPTYNFVKQEEDEAEEEGPSGTGDHKLLREVLKDTSFQKKYNLKPFDIGSLAVGFVGGAQQKKTCKPMDTGEAEGDLEQLDRDTIEPMLSLAIEQMRKDIDTTCSVLGISPDPTRWSSADVRSWLTWTTQQFNLSPVDLNQFDIEGHQLAALPEEELQQRDPQNGALLFAQLEIWRTACGACGTPVVTSSEAPSEVAPSPVASHHYQDDDHVMVATPESMMANSPNSGMASSASSADTSDDEDEDRSVATASPGVNGHSNSAASARGAHIHLWQFLKELLCAPHVHGSCVRWLDRPQGVFKIEDSVRVARLWGARKNRPAMNYDKLSRSIRQYYKKGIMRKTERSQRLVYQFCHPYSL